MTRALQHFAARGISLQRVLTGQRLALVCRSHPFHTVLAVLIYVVGTGTASVKRKPATDRGR